MTSSKQILLPFLIGRRKIACDVASLALRGQTRSAALRKLQKALPHFLPRSAFPLASHRWLAERRGRMSARSVTVGTKTVRMWLKVLNNRCGPTVASDHPARPIEQSKRIALVSAIYYIREGRCAASSNLEAQWANWARALPQRGNRALGLKDTGPNCSRGPSCSPPYLQCIFRDTCSKRLINS